MTRKDYILISNSIKKNFDGSNEGFYHFIMDLCDLLYADNPQFDYDRFLNACGVKK